MMGFLRACTNDETMKFSEQPTLIWEVVPPYILHGRNYFANYFDFKNNFSPYKLYGGQPPRSM